ncbi:tyrosine-type recombinase/integrase [Pelobacter propionicus]|uniref:Phage integrase family protein n=1 Tax=Pelobacter propionicus (strain DSM 2379 / NBRC 103807 / OttBd1) TaxID=338966 RepID=A1ANR7_PELPD|nr:site-specific integrase [Pelobacter propionicus]ABK98987.1 phage integrase family protein [Pelobacter propionicus DSM 2379]
MKFTDTGIRNLKPKEKMYQVREGDGFGVRVLPSGLRIFVFIYTIAGKRRQMNLGDYPAVSLSEARERAADARKVLSRERTDPQEHGFSWHYSPERERREMAAKEKEELENPTVKQLITRYIERYAMKNKKSWQEDKRILEKDVLPLWGDRKAKDVIRRDVIQLLDGMQGRGDGIITNTFKIIRRMFRYGVKQELIPTTPCYGFEKGDELPTTKSKERTLTETEIKAFWGGIDRCMISEDVRRILKLTLLTGQRPGEVASMHSSEISGRWWEFSPKETKITKEVPRKQRIYLTDMTLSLIREKEGYIFPSPKIRTNVNEQPIDTPITERAVAYALRRNLLTHTVKPKPATWKKSSHQSKDKKKFIIPDDKKLDIEKFCPHDLRRTCATILSEIGFSDEIVDAVLAHLKKGEIKTYNKNKYDKERQKALEAWERKLKSIITGQKDNVVPLTHKAA